VNDDLSIPATPDPPWIYEANLFRGQPSAVYVAASPNLVAAITDLCVAACAPEGFAEVSIQVNNAGGADVAPGVPVRLYGSVSGTWTLIDETATPPLPSGSSFEYAVDTTVAALGDELKVVVDEDAAVGEGDEDDNTGAWLEVPACG